MMYKTFDHILDDSDRMKAIRDFNDHKGELTGFELAELRDFIINYYLNN